MSNSIATVIYEDHKGGLWIGTEGGGLNLYDHEKDTFNHYVHNPVNDLSISDNSITSIFEDRTGDLWIGTWGGLIRFNRQDENFVHYFMNGIHETELVMGMLEDDENNIWIATSGTGLFKFNPYKNEVQNFRNDIN